MWRAVLTRQGLGARVVKTGLNPASYHSHSSLGHNDVYVSKNGGNKSDFPGIHQVHKILSQLLNGCIDLRSRCSRDELISQKYLGMKCTTCQLCAPEKENKEYHSGFGKRKLYFNVEKWWYSVVVVSGSISWLKLFFKHDQSGEHVWYHCITDDQPYSLSSHVLPINGPAKPIDPVDSALASFEQAVIAGTAITQNAMGVQFAALKMDEKALAYFESACNKGNVSASFNLGLCYENGVGTPVDLTKAITFYDSAASRGHIEASFNLAGIYLRGQVTADKITEGLKLMKMAAGKGFVKAQRFLGLYFADETNVHYDMKMSVKWLHEAAENNDSTAQYHLGICYERGWGVGRNMQKAKDLYKQAAESGHTDAQYNYGVFNENGLGGLPINKSEALSWYKMAIAGGNLNAKRNAESLKHAKERTVNTSLYKLIPSFWKAQEPGMVTSSGTLPRCSSSPGRLSLASEEDSPSESATKKLPDHCISVF